MSVFLKGLFSPASPRRNSLSGTTSIRASSSETPRFPDRPRLGESSSLPRSSVLDGIRGTDTLGSSVVGSSPLPGRRRSLSKDSLLIGTTSGLKPSFSSSISTDLTQFKGSTLESTRSILGGNTSPPFSSSLASDIQRMESDIQKRGGGLHIETASNLTIGTLTHFENDLQKTRGSLLNDSTPVTPVSRSLEPFERKMEQKRDELLQAQSKTLGDQISHLLKDMSDMRDDMRKEIMGIARREEALRAEVVQRHEELERQCMALASRETDTIAAMEVQAKELQKVVANSAIAQRDIDDALDRGLKGLHQSLEKGLEREANQRAEQTNLTKQALEEHRVERDNAFQIIRQEKEAAFQQHARDRQEALQAQHRETMEHTAQERKLREEGQRALQDGLRAIEIQLHRDTEKQVKEQAEALKGLEQKLRAERDEIMKIIRNERDAAFQQHTRDRQEALQAQHREAMEHMVQERKLRDEGQRATQDGLRALEVKLHRDTEKQVKDQAEALKALEQKLRFERDELLKVIRQEKEAAFQQHTKDRQEALQAQQREAMQHMAQEGKLRDDGQRALQDGLRALEVKLHRDTEKQVKDQAEALKALEQKLRTERDELLKLIRQEKEIAFQQNAKDRQEALQAQHREAMEHMMQERKLRDEGQRTMQDNFKAFEIKVHRDTEKQVSDQAEALKALEQKMYADLQRVIGEHTTKLQDMKELVQVAGRENADKVASAMKYLRDDFENSLRSTNSNADALGEALERKVDHLEKKTEGYLAETHSALQTMLAEQSRNFANEQAVLREAQTVLKTEIQNRLAELEKRLNKSHDELLNDIQNISGVHNKKHEQTKDLVKSVSDTSNQQYDSLSQALDGMQKSQQRELDVLRSDMAGTHSSLREVLTEVTKQVDNLDQNIQREHLLILTAEDKFEKSLDQMRSNISESIQESNETTRLVLVEHGKKAEETKLVLQKDHNALKGEIDDNKASSEQTFRDQIAKDKRLQEEIASLQQQMSSLLSEVHSSHEALRSSLAIAAKNVEDLGETSQREHQRMRQEIIDGVNEKHAAMRKDLLSADQRFIASVDGLRSATQDAHKVLRDEMSGNMATSERVVKELTEGTQRALRELSDLNDKVAKDMEADFRNSLQGLTETTEGRHSDLRSLLETIDKTHHEKHAITAAGLEDAKKLLSQEMSDHLKMCVEELEDTLRREQQSRLAVEERLDKSCMDTRREIMDVVNTTQTAFREDVVKTSKSIDVLKTAMQESLLALKSEVNYNLKEASARAASQVGEVESALDKEQKKRIALEEALEKVCIEVRQDIMAEVNETKAALRSDMEVTNQKAKDMKSDLQDANAMLRKEISDELRLNKELVEELQGNMRSERERRVVVEGELDKACMTMRQEIMDAMNERHASVTQDLVATRNNTDELKSGLQEAHRALQTEMREHQAKAERTSKDLSMETQTSLVEIRELSELTIKEIQAELKRDLEIMADAMDQKHGDVRTLLESVDAEHHKKHDRNVAALEELTTKALGSTQKKMKEEILGLKHSVEDAHNELSEFSKELSRQLAELTAKVKKEQIARLKADELQEKAYNELRRDITGKHLEKNAVLRSG